MKHVLHKCSVPGWSKEFATYREAVNEMRAHVCGECRSGKHAMVGTDEIHEVPPPNLDDLWDMLDTACGCEYEYEAQD